MAVITFTRLTDDDREQFILDNQRAFKYGAMEEFGMRESLLGLYDEKKLCGYVCIFPHPQRLPFSES